MINPLDYPRDTSLWDISGTDSFRLGSRMLFPQKGERPGYNIGGNRANVEKTMRRIWIADIGYLLCQRDQGGAEAMIVSYLCKEGNYRKLFQVGIKPHTYLALKLFKDVWIKEFGKEKIEILIRAPIEELPSIPFWREVEDFIKLSDKNPAKKRYYHFAKKTVHAASYGMYESTFQLAMLKESGGLLDLSLDECKMFLAAFHAEFPEIRQWHNKTLEIAETNKQLRNLFGYPFNITTVINPENFRDLIAWVPQSTVACITRQAYIKTYRHIVDQDKQWHMLNDNHDSYMVEAPIQEIEECSSTMKDHIEVKLISPTDGTEFQMKSSATIGNNWAFN